MKLMAKKKLLQPLKGITLFELLLAVTLISVVMLFSYLLIFGQLQKARDGRRKSDLEKIKTSLYDYYFDVGCFPESLPDCGERLNSKNMIYLNQVPCDPNKNSYAYQTNGGVCPDWFKVLSNLENPEDLSIDKVGCRFGCGEECDYNYGVASGNISLNEDCLAYYACAPSGECVEFEDPWISRCPRVFENDPACGATDCRQRINRCHDNRGKKVPEE